MLQNGQLLMIEDETHRVGGMQDESRVSESHLGAN